MQQNDTDWTNKSDDSKARCGMAISMFLRIEGIKGESRDERHRDEIEVLSFQWGESSPASQTQGPGGGAGKVEMSAFHLSAASSQASPVLFLACASGRHFKEAVLSLARPVGGRGQDFMVWKLQSVLVSAYRTGGGQADSGPMDEFELSFEQIEVQYQPLDEAGRPGPEVKAGWDLKSNRPV
jgi:type VI secretion system secreted protein Hcp